MTTDTKLAFVLTKTPSGRILWFGPYEVEPGSCGAQAALDSALAWGEDARLVTLEQAWEAANITTTAQEG